MVSLDSCFYIFTTLTLASSKYETVGRQRKAFKNQLFKNEFFFFIDISNLKVELV